MCAIQVNTDNKITEKKEAPKQDSFRNRFYLRVILHV